MRPALQRLLLAVPILLIVTFVVFVLVDLAPGDPAANLAGDNPSPERIEAVRQELGLDRPLPARYVDYVSSAFTGDFGTSLANRQAVTTALKDRITVTLSLALVTVVMMVGGALVFGIIAATWRNRWPDRLITWLASIAVAIPPFWLGLVLILQLAVYRSWFPALGYSPIADGWWEWLRHLILPAFTLALLPGAELTLQLKASLVEVMGRDYVLAVRAKGMSTRTVILKHGLKNAAVPVVTVLGHRMAQLLGGTVIVERVFNLNGIGSAAVDATLNRDIPIIMAIVVMSTITVIVVNLLVDISYGYFNPKVRT
ncbi:MAG: ABC transporter permease [Ilumatobacteraceae bacterium]